MAKAKEHWQVNLHTLVSRTNYILNSELLSDIKFLVGEEKKTIIFGHKLLLALGSPVFQQEFYGKFQQKEIIEVPDIEPHIFLILLKYIYTDEIDFTLNVDDYINLLYAADKYIIPSLINNCIEILIALIKVDSIFKILETAKFFNKDKLRDASRAFIERSSKDIAKSDHFLKIDKGSLTDFLSRNGLYVSESILAYATVKWAKAKCQEQGKEPTIENQRSILGNILRLIRFPVMDSTVFSKFHEDTRILTSEQALDILMSICQSPNMPKITEFPTKPRCFKPWYWSVYRFEDTPTAHTFNSYGGPLYNYSISFKVTRGGIFLYGVKLFSILLEQQEDVRNDAAKLDVSIRLYENNTETKHNILLTDLWNLGDDSDYYFEAKFEKEILLQAEHKYKIQAEVRVNNIRFVPHNIHSFTGSKPINEITVMAYKALDVKTYVWDCSCIHNTIGPFTDSQIPALMFNF